jgi:TPR repeat protein
MNAVWLMVAFLLGMSLAPALRAQSAGPGVENLRLWADRGDSDAQFELGLRLLTGEGVTKDLEQGRKWVLSAAEAEHLRAQYVMGSVYEDGLGVPRDEGKAVQWYRRSAQHGFAPAQFAVAVAYDTGRGVAKDEAKALEWLQRAADQQHAQAQTALAVKYEMGQGGVKADPAKAALWYLRAANQQWVQAMTRLAHLYYTGNGVPLDFRRAGAWYQRAARSEDPWAANNLAWFLATCPDESMHDASRALAEANRAIRLMDEAGESQPYEMYDTKAACLARQGDFLGAVIWQKKAMELMAQDKELPAQERGTLQGEFQSRLKLYQEQSAYTEPEAKAKAPAPALPQDRILQEEPLPGGRGKAPSKKSTAPQKGFA